MHGSEDEPSSGSQVHNPLVGIVAHFIRRSIAQHSLRIYTATPEGDVFAKLALQFCLVHSGGAHLHRVEDVYADLNQVSDHRADCTARMEEELGLRAGVDEVEQLFVQWFYDPTIHGR